MKLFDEYSIRDLVEKKISELVSPIKRQSKIWVFRCPICGDSKKNKRKTRGYYYTDTCTYHCFNEGCHSSGLNIISQFTSKSYDDVKRDYMEYMKKYLKQNNEVIPNIPIIENNINKDINNKVNNEFIIPDNWIDLPLYVRQYITSRKIYTAPNIPKNYKMFFDTIKTRLVLPWYEDGKITFYQERALIDKQTPKYLFPYNMEKHVFGIDDIDINFPYIFLVEGVLDSIFIKNGVAIGGISLSNHQEETIKKRFPFHELIYFFDNQWTDTASLNNTLKIANNNKQRVFIWEKNIKYKDVNEYIMNNNDNIFFNNDYLVNNSFKGLKIIIKLK